jgi:pseudouridine synthase
MQRLAKLIAAAGVTSRRKAGDLVRAGRVRVDGAVVTDPGLEVDVGRAAVTVDGRAITAEPKRYLILNKPRGPLSTVVDQRGRKTVLDLLGDPKERLFPAGRLDADTEGLLLISNDGDLTHRLTHPRYGVQKVYEAEVAGRPSGEAVRKLERGVMLPEGRTGPVEIKVLRGSEQRTVLEITVHTGRKRMIRRLLKGIGHPVVTLRRTRLGPLTVGGLEPGEWRELTDGEVAELDAYTRARAAPHTSAARSAARRRGGRTG